MSQNHAKGVLVRCTSCKAKLRAPESAAGKRIRCPKCGAELRVDAGAAAVSDPPRKAAAPALKLRCPHCRAKIKLPAGSVGRKAKCPACAGVLRVPDAAPPSSPDSASSERLGVDDLLSIAPPEDLPANLPSSTVPQVVPTKEKRKCPTCGKEYPGDAKVCVECGVYLDSGRSIIITQDENLDQIYMVAQRTIWWISWIIWLGVYPIASEAFGLRKPWVVPGVAVLTICVSLVFLACMIVDAPALETFNGMMLWAGNTEDIGQIADEFAEEVRAEQETDAEPNAQTREIADQEVRDSLASIVRFHPYQLITHAFLHGGLLHLAGNMLFLMVLGTRVNALIGNIWALVLYPLLAIIAGVAEMISLADGPPTPMIGASGAVMGLAGMYLVLFPVHKVHMAAWVRWGLLLRFRLSLKLFDVRGFWVVLAYISLDILFTALGAEDGVAHWAHIGGFAGGAVLATILLLTRLVDAQGGDIVSVILGRRARKLLGR